MQIILRELLGVTEMHKAIQMISKQSWRIPCTKQDQKPVSHGDAFLQCAEQSGPVLLPPLICSYFDAFVCFLYRLG